MAALAAPLAASTGALAQTAGVAEAAPGTIDEVTADDPGSVDATKPSGTSDASAAAGTSGTNAESAVDVRAGVDKAVATTGDIITFTVTVEHAPGIELVIPEPGAEIAGFRLVDLGKDTTDSDPAKIVTKRWYQLRADLVGSYVLPPVRVAWRHTDQPEAKPLFASTSEIFVEVQSVLPVEGEMQDIRDIKPLRRIAEPPPWIAMGVGSVALMALLLGLFFWIRRRRKTYEVVAAAAHEIAFAALDNLRQADFSDAEAVHAWYFSISEILRAYVEGRYGLNATDLTSEEIANALSAYTDIPPLSEDRLKRFMTRSDQVKFASHQPGEDEISETYEDALSFVEETKERPEVDPAAPQQEMSAA